LRHLRFNREDVIQVSVVFLRPDACVGASVHQLCIYVHLCARTPHRSFQDVGDAQGIADLLYILFTAILHHAGAADHFEVGDFSVDQNVIWTPSVKALFSSLRFSKGSTYAR
jgi:hypothetical protein